MRISKKESQKLKDQSGTGKRKNESWVSLARRLFYLTPRTAKASAIRFVGDVRERFATIK